MYRMKLEIHIKAMELALEAEEDTEEAQQALEAVEVMVGWCLKNQLQCLKQELEWQLPLKWCPSIVQI